MIGKDKKAAKTSKARANSGKAGKTAAPEASTPAQTKLPLQGKRIKPYAARAGKNPSAAGSLRGSYRVPTSREKPMIRNLGTPEGTPVLGYLVKAAGLPARFDHQDLMRRANEGVSIRVIDALKDWTSTAVLADTIAPATTLSRWRKLDQLLTGNAADSTLRLVNIIAQAEQVFGDADKARNWLAKPKQKLDPERPGISPFELVKSEHGARLVEERLAQIAHGMFA